MFSKGTFQRYFFEIERTQKQMHELYGRLAGEIKDPAARTVLAEFLCELDSESRELNTIRAAIDQA